MEAEFRKNLSGFDSYTLSGLSAGSIVAEGVLVINNQDRSSDAVLSDTRQLLNTSPITGVTSYNTQSKKNTYLCSNCVHTKVLQLHV